MVDFLNRLYRVLQNYEYYLLLACVFVAAALVVGGIFVLWVRRNQFRDRLQRFLPHKAQGGTSAGADLVGAEVARSLELE